MKQSRGDVDFRRSDDVTTPPWGQAVTTSTFHCDLFDLLGFLVDPFLPTHFLRGAHQVFELFDLL